MDREAHKKIACPCNSCAGTKMVAERTYRRHMQKQSVAESESSTKRPRTEEESAQEGPLHEMTEMTGFMLCLRLLMLYNAFSGVTQQCMNQIIRLIADLLGGLVPNSKLPRDFKSITNLMDKCLTPMVKYTACPEECELFKGDIHKCRKEKCIGKDSVKKYFYLPLIPRLRQLYSNKEIAKNLQIHSTQLPSHNPQDIRDSAAWEELYGEGGQFDGDYRALALEFSADGFQPFHHTTTKPYSIEQQASVILNLPPEMRTNPGFVLLHGLIPGPQAPKEESFNIYLKPLVDEVELLTTVGVDGVWDAYREEYFKLKAKILLHVHDFPGQSKIFHGSGCGGKHPCPKCLAEGTYSRQMNKMIFRSGREFLEEGDPLRQDTRLPGGGIEEGTPRTRDFQEETVMAAVSGVLAEVVRESQPRSKERRNANAAHAAVMAHGGRKRCSEFDRLSDKEASKIVVEGMHTIQGVGKNLHGLLNGHKDSNKVRAHENAINRFQGCSGEDARGRLNDAPFTLTRDDMVRADERVSRISIPSEKGSLPAAIFNVCYSMKSHTWHLVLTKGVYLYALRGLLGTSQRVALFAFCHIMGIVSSKTVYMDLMPMIQRHLHRSMVIMDREFPETLKTILWHMLHHLPDFLKRYGPVQSYWMFYFERMIHHHVSRLHSSKHPEASIVTSYRIDAFCALFGMGIKTKTDEPVSQGFREYYKEERGHTWRGGDDSAHDGSVVYMRDDSGVYFGRVQSFFALPGSASRYAKIHWYERATEDDESKLLTCQTNTQSSQYPAVPVESLSQPLIFAEEGDTLFALDFLDHERTRELLGWMDTVL